MYLHKVLLLSFSSLKDSLYKIYSITEINQAIKINKKLSLEVSLQLNPDIKNQSSAPIPYLSIMINETFSVFK